jgi:hypothetical protein
MFASGVASYLVVLNYVKVLDVEINVLFVTNIQTEYNL